MAAEVESMMYAGEVPWHGLGKKLDGPATSREAITQAGLDWLVEKRPLYTLHSDRTMTTVPDNFATVRASDEHVLGVVGQRYTPLQNAEAFAFFDNIVGEGMAIYHTAGSLRGGRNVFVLAKLPETMIVKGDDVVDQYLLLSNSHDGTSGVQVMFTPIRVVCMNTLNAAVRTAEKSNRHRVRHTVTVNAQLANIGSLLAEAHTYFDATQKSFQEMAKRPFIGIDFSKYMRDVVFSHLGEDEDISARSLVVRDKLIDLFENDPRNRMPETKHTLWSAYNAITQFVDYERGKGDNRVYSAWFGSGSQLKQRAYSEALAYV